MFLFLWRMLHSVKVYRMMLTACNLDTLQCCKEIACKGLERKVKYLSLPFTYI